MDPSHQMKFQEPHLDTSKTGVMTLCASICLSMFTPKSRGIPTGPDLDQTDISGVKVTKTVLARLTGQCYQVSGVFLDPVLIAFKIYFSQCCKLLSGWNERRILPVHHQGWEQNSQNMAQAPHPTWLKTKEDCLPH